MGIKKFPLIKYTLAFSAGIISTSVLKLQVDFFTISVAVLALVFIQFLFKNKFRHSGLMIKILIIAILGNYYMSLRKIENVDYSFPKTRILHSELYGVVESISLIHNERFSLIIKSDSIRIKDSLFTVAKKIKCNISIKNKSELSGLFRRIKIGNRLLLKGTLQKARCMRNPGEFDYHKYLQSKGISGLFYVRNSKSVEFIGDDESLFENYVFNVRKYISREIDRLHNKRTAALLKGLLLADRGDIDYKTKENFINSGVIHVLAVSGLHVGFIVVIFMFLFSRFPIYIRTMLTVAGLIAFLIITNMPASVFRATIMVIVLFAAFLDNRKYNSINALAITALILLLLNPSEIFNPGFQLSFSAVLSILIIYPVLSSKIKMKNRAVKSVLLFFAVSFSAQLGTLPFTLIYFQKLSIISMLANLFVIPIIGVIVALGVLTLVTASISTTLGMYFASSNMLATDLLLYIVNFSGSVDYAYISIPNFSLIDGVIFYLFTSLALYVVHKFNNRVAIMFALLLIGANLFFYLQLDNKELLPNGKLSVMLIDIGQGDGILLKFPNGKTALIDAGNASKTFDNGERIIAPLLKRLGIRKIDFGFITHVDSDHYKGFIYLLNHRFIREVYKPKLDTTLKKDLHLEEEIRKNEIPLHYYGKSIIDFNSARLYILNDTTDVKYQHLDMNNKSGVFKVVFGSTGFLFTGDAEREAEKRLIDKYQNFLHSNVLKLGHHGSKSSTTEAFLNFVNPKIGLISAGENNKFGHPAGIIIDRLKKRNIVIYRTDIEGAVILSSDGERIKKTDWRKF